MHRRIIKVMQKHYPAMGITCAREKKHVILRVEMGGKVINTSVSKTPRSPDHEIRNACRIICKLFDLPLIKF